ncbi:small-conductance mechanosensitive channel MscS [Enterobacter quasiroggenkampii]|uniref:small-conductance mechanosensitive channel MscS n=1 Tax=Enterobacter quasiroggenkampii TaxID=2497436 RepID=UPI0021D07E0B|nr:small-conductance mechanosensitive channel MscS [Enterobacter quasiroggenkampii]MCU6306360.1 small-conductance mechanosensitive channel MscS [Enterobacter quasiroggenkampii]MCU6398440.1 small-conductance mechanosensitive channel MscS [Enterobacter quasiroggenkampii]
MKFEAFPGIRQFIFWVSNNESTIVQGFINLIGAVIILCTGIFISRVTSAGFKRLLLSRNVDKTITQFCSALLRYAMVAFASIAALGRIGVETSSIIAVIGAAGLAVGLALQGSLANFAAGVLLVTLRPIRAGEYASVGAVAGTIEEVHIFSTTLRTSDNKVVVVPNGKIIASEITNYSRQKERRVDITVGVSYCTSIDHIKNVLKTVVMLDPRIVHSKGHTIRLSEFAPSTLNFVVRVWTENRHYWDVYYDLMENIKNALDANQIQMPFPQMDVHLHNSPKMNNAEKITQL